ncbi:hypothetical protein ACHQM5_020731 [Ranunculus cassubicifolius]
MGGSDNNKTAEHSSSSKTPPPWENSNHPLFLHHSDQPGAVLVPQELMEDNYNTWIESMSMALTIKNKKGFVDGSIPRPTSEKIDELQQWERCNTLVKTWLLGSMSKEIKSSVIRCKDAVDMWLELHERFSHVNGVQLFHIENEIHDCEQGNKSVTSYFTKLKGLWDERDVLCEIPSCSCEATKRIKSYMETQKTMKFLMGLNDSYATVRSNALLLDPLPGVSKVYSLVLRHEKQAEVSSGKALSQPEAAAFAVRKATWDIDFGEGGRKCEKCHRTNHITKNCRAHLKCTFCNGKGHTYDWCRKRKAAEEDAQNRSKGNHLSGINDKKEAASNFPFSHEECQQILSMLNKNKASAANQVGNAQKYEELSGPTFGEDDWDGN